MKRIIVFMMMMDAMVKINERILRLEEYLESLVISLVNELLNHILGYQELKI